ncbi:hypothetical protein CEXT_59331 [Caerostris extrusa]|uniref:Uncharacterized protein n=1 Tax=Caerostris extrusa TaxID=172846 RepID=A0AAV4PK25_CAEEX|nr:hypothetical protein CEXT_59331 [Caerostris extrusa]
MSHYHFKSKHSIFTLLHAGQLSLYLNSVFGTRQLAKKDHVAFAFISEFSHFRLKSASIGGGGGGVNETKLFRVQQIGGLGRGANKTKTISCAVSRDKSQVRSSPVFALRCLKKTQKFSQPQLRNNAARLHSRRDVVKALRMKVAIICSDRKKVLKKDVGNEIYCHTYTTLFFLVPLFIRFHSELKAQRVPPGVVHNALLATPNPFNPPSDLRNFFKKSSSKDDHLAHSARRKHSE